MRVLDRHPQYWKKRGDPLGCAEIDSINALIYARKIERITIAYNLSFSALLAHAPVHQIGHVLLGREHDSGGIIRGRWDRSAFQAIAQRWLTFDARECAAMQRAAHVAERLN